MAGVGLETRTSILPTINIGTGPGVMGPDYSFADNIKFPDQVGVRDGSSMDSVIDSVKAVGYYTDMIGFGESSSFLSRGLGVQPLGVNFFQRTGFTCSNGAEMWQYIESIPKGDSLGQRVDEGLRRSGLPRLRGLAPGIIEDAKAALDPRPVMQAVFGGGSPRCRWEVREVGDQNGSIQGPNGSYYIENPETAYQQNGRTVQGRWVFDTNLSKEEWEKVPKTHCPNGYPKKNHRNGNCKDVVENRSIEAFTSENSKKVGTGILLGIAVVGTLFLLKVSQGR